MKIVSFRVQNYRSIIDTNNIDMEDVMVLVGPNQAGKSSVLKGLNSLSFDYFYDINNELTQLEKINKNYVDKETPPKDLPIITVTFQLEASDTEYLKQENS